MSRKTDTEMRSQDQVITWFLGSLAFLGMTGIGLLAVLRLDAQPLGAITGACIGALVTRFTMSDRRQSEDSEVYEMLGKAANRQMIENMLRTSAQTQPDPKGDRS